MSGTDPPNGVYEFGEFRLDPARRELARRGEPVPIGAKAFDALVHLVEHAGMAVTRRELAQALWPTTVVEDNNLSQTVLALRRALGDSQDAPRFVATVPRRGYQFVAPVRRVPADSPAGLPKAEPVRPRRAGAVWALAVVAVVAAAGWFVWQGSQRESSAVGTATGAPIASPSDAADGASPTGSPGAIAVLPFQNLSPLPEHAYFAAGVHEEVLSQLARIRGLEVKGRTSVLRYAEGATPLETIVRELGVAAVLEGSVRYADERVRVSVRLVDGVGTERWSETYDETLGDVFSIQADIAGRIAAELAAELSPAERRDLAAPPTESLEAYAHYLQAIALYRARGGIGVSMPPETRAEIDGLLGEALGLDPDFAAALGWRAHVALDALLFDPIPEQDSDLTRAAAIERIERDAARALELDPAQEMAHVALARLDMYRWRLEDALARLERVHRLRPSDSAVLHYVAVVSMLLDDYANAVEKARRALELDPRNPAPYTPLVLGLRALGDRAGAASAARSMIELAPAAPIGYMHLARVETDGGSPERILEAARLAERFFDERTRNFRADAALAYARAGAHADAERAIRTLEAVNAGGYVEPGLAAMARLALRDYPGARQLIEQAIASRASGMDPFPLFFIRQNAWTDPVLDTPEWQALRDRLGYPRRSTAGRGPS